MYTYTWVKRPAVTWVAMAWVAMVILTLRLCRMNSSKCLNSTVSLFLHTYSYFDVSIQNVRFSNADPSNVLNVSFVQLGLSKFEFQRSVENFAPCDEPDVHCVSSAWFVTHRVEKGQIARTRLPCS